MRKHLFLQLLFLCLAPLSTALAQDVVVRAGAHEEYSRLVFDWASAPDYSTARPQEGTFQIRFEKNTGLDSAQLAQQPVANIKALEVVGTAPLTVNLTIPESSEVRDFLAGSKVVIDVYNPPAGAKPEAGPIAVGEPAEPQAPEPATETVAVAEAETEANPEVVAEEDAPALPAPEMAEDAPGMGAAPLTTPPPVDEPVTQSADGSEGEDGQILQARAVPTTINISSTTPFGFAAFVKDGRLWLAAGRNDAMIRPQVNGPQAEGFTPFIPMQSAETKIFSGNYVAGNALKGQGGSILWRVIASPDMEEPQAPVPRRTNVDENRARSGALIWPFKSAQEVITVQDPASGETVFIALVGEDGDFAGPAQEFVDFDVLRSPIGLAVRPKVEDLSVEIVRGGVQVSRPGGLALSAESRAKLARQKREQDEQSFKAGASPLSGEQRIYNFNGWRMGGMSALAENRTIILGRLKQQPAAERAASLLVLAKAYLANYMGPEALGLLRFVEQELPGIVDTPEYLSLRGAALVMSGKDEAAFRDLSIGGLKSYPEINVWRAHALAQLGDWQQAAELTPRQAYDIIAPYPRDIRTVLALSLAEIYLRAGNTAQATRYIEMVEKDARRLRPGLLAALTYLKGEKARQNGDLEATEKAWLSLARGTDDLYRAKASLALTRFLVDEGKMPPRQAIDKLEGLRYAWRGDDLEAHINYWLGRTYFENGDYIKGLNIMRDATSYATHQGLSQRIANDMSEVFIDLFNSGKLDDVTALDAVTLYEQFRELSPPDERGDEIVENLAEHLVKAGLIGRAGDLLQYQVDHRLEGEEAVRIAMRLAAIRLVDERADDAMRAVEKAQSVYDGLADEQKSEQKSRTLTFLRARALSKQGHPDKALELLQDMELSPQLNRLKADIAWDASYWDDAGEALQDVILDQNISLTRPLSAENTELLIQRAVALNLAGDRVALANMREKYSESMSQTDQARVFEVITRPRQSISLADRETLLSIVSEVDLFQGILNGIKDGEAGEDGSVDSGDE